MDYLQFLSSIISSIAWPATIGIILWCYKTPLLELLGRIKSFKGLGVEAEFKESMEELREAAKASGVVPKPLLHPDSKNPEKTLDNAIALTELQPREAVLLGWRAVQQQAVLCFPDMAVKGYGGHAFIPNPVLDKLHESERIDKNIHNLLLTLQKTRNKAHPKDAVVTAQDAGFFLAVAKSVIDTLKNNK